MIHSVEPIYFYVPAEFTGLKFLCSFDFCDEFIEIYEISSLAFLVNYEVSTPSSDLPFTSIHFRVEVDSKNDFYNISFNTLKSLLI